VQAFWAGSSKKAAIWFAFGRNLNRWAEIVRTYDSAYRQKTHIFVLVNSAEEASTAVEEVKPDFLVAQGFESGGHGSARALPLLTLLPAILEEVPPDMPHCRRQYCERPPSRCVSSDGCSRGRCRDAVPLHARKSVYA